jgi:hypothetical protein
MIEYQPDPDNALLCKFTASLPEVMERMGRLGSCDYCREGFTRAKYQLERKIGEILTNGPKWGNAAYLLRDEQFDAQHVYARTMASYAIGRPFGHPGCTCPKIATDPTLSGAS